MGTDINVHTEVKIAGKWHHYGQPRVDRCYTLFAKMSGERLQSDWNITPLAAHPGMPSDATELTAFCADHDGVEHGRLYWLDRDQIAELNEWFVANAPDNGGAHGFEGIFDYAFHNAWANGGGVAEDWRFIFWYN